MISISGFGHHWNWLQNGISQIYWLVDEFDREGTVISRLAFINRLEAEHYSNGFSLMRVGIPYKAYMLPSDAKLVKQGQSWMEVA